MGSTRPRALWVGGPPSQTLQRIRCKLQADGVDVVDVQETFRAIGRHVDLVLVNIDMVSHGCHERARAGAEALGIQCVSVHTSYSRTARALSARGLIEESFEVHEEEAEMADDNNPATQSLDANAIDSFLGKVPRELLPFLKTQAERLLRQEDVQNAAVALASLNGDGLADLVALLPREILDELRGCLGVPGTAGRASD